MIDDDDASFFALLMSPTTWVGLIACVAVVLGLVYVANSNKAECSKRPCSSGQAKLLDGECVCVSEPGGER